MMIGNGTETQPYIYLPESEPLGSLFFEAMRLNLDKVIDGWSGPERARHRVRVVKCPSGHTLAVLYEVGGVRVLDLCEAGLSAHMVQLILKLHGDDFESRPVVDDCRSGKYARVCLRLPEELPESLSAARIPLACPCMWSAGLKIGDVVNARGEESLVSPDVSGSRGRRADTVGEMTGKLAGSRAMLKRHELLREYGAEGDALFARYMEENWDRLACDARREAEGIKDRRRNAIQ